MAMRASTCIVTGILSARGYFSLKLSILNDDVPKKEVWKRTILKF